MVAYSFKKQFIDPICVGLGIPRLVDVGPLPAPKRQTIRANRKRHARPGEELQLYCGMRTRHFSLIGRARCTAVEDIRMDFNQWPRVYKDSGHCEDAVSLDEFARQDGFTNWFELFQFWRKEHGNIVIFSGKLIRWKPLT
jgi:hypothetical protein